MATIHGGSMATGQYAKGSSEHLARHNVIHLDEDVARGSLDPLAY